MKFLDRARGRDAEHPSSQSSPASTSPPRSSRSSISFTAPDDVLLDLAGQLAAAFVVALEDGRELRGFAAIARAQDLERGFGAWKCVPVR